MLVRELVAALKDAPQDARVSAWQPRGDDGEFFVKVLTYDRSNRTLNMLANASEVSVGERILHEDAQ